MGSMHEKVREWFRVKLQEDPHPNIEELLREAIDIFGKDPEFVQSLLEGCIRQAFVEAALTLEIPAP